MDSSNFPWPTGHGGWFFSGAAQFEARVARFLAVGLRRHERVMFVAEEPIESRWPAELLENGALVVAAVEDVYRPLMSEGPEAQIGVFAAELERALQAGYSGIRVAADNTSAVVADVDRWLEWESVVEAFIAANPVTGLCAFNHAILTEPDIDQLLVVHAESLVRTDQ